MNAACMYAWARLLMTVVAVFLFFLFFALHDQHHMVRVRRHVQNFHCGNTCMQLGSFSHALIILETFTLHGKGAWALGLNGAAWEMSTSNAVIGESVI